MIGDYFAPHTIHDPENPVIKEKYTFGDKEEFIQIMRTYAIKNEFETKVEHSDTERYRARCAAENCEWKVYAKKLHGGITYMVIILPSMLFAANFMIMLFAAYLSKTCNLII
jgi:hypothetical protein